MKIIWLLILGVLLSLPVSVIAQAVPQDTDSATIQIINQEHKNTRKFFSDELTRQRNDFYKEFQDRATYYETEANSIVKDAVWKLGLMWGGVVFLIFGMSNFLGRRLEKRKWTKMLDSAKTEILAEVNKEKQVIDQQHKAKEQQIVQATKQVNQRNADLNTKSEQLAKARPQLIAMQQKIAQQQKELKDVMGNLDMFGGKV